MALRILNYVEAESSFWDEFCQSALQATLLHSRRFLNYHGDRFIDRSIIFQDDTKIVGLMAAAQSPSESSEIVSHPGLTYGGILHQKGLRGAKMIEAFELLRSHYSNLGYKKLIYKAVPYFYHRNPAQDDLYALYRVGANRIRCDLSCTIDLHERGLISTRRKRSLKKAERSGIVLSEGEAYLPFFWDILKSNLDTKHGVSPVHSLEEMTQLMKLFPENILCVCSCLNGSPIAGALIFVTPTSFHAQYIAANVLAHELGALDFLFDDLILKATLRNKRWFDFGISSEKNGMILNEGLFAYKSEFGAGSSAHEFYELDLV